MNPEQDLLDDIVIAQPKTTTIGKRIGAALIDGLILAALLIIIFNLFGERYEQTTTTTTTVSTTPGQTNPTTTREVTTSSGIHLEGWPVIGCLVCWFFLIPFREGRGGQTIGKKALRIKVIRSNGDPVGIGPSFVRHLFDVIDCLLLIGLLIAMSNPQQKRIGDFVAGTRVVDRS